MKKERIFLTGLWLGLLGAWILFSQRHDAAPEKENPRPAPVAPGTPPPQTPPREEKAAPPRPMTPTASERPAAEPVLSRSVAALLAPDTPFAARCEIIQTLSRDLSAEETDALRAFLSTSPSDHPGMRPAVLNSIKNDILEVLIDQRTLPAGLTEQVTALFTDPKGDYMWREYALQSLQSLYERVDPESEGGDAARIASAVPNSDKAVHSAQERILGILFSALDERKKDLAGTALLSLNRMTKQNDRIDREQVLAAAVDIAQDPQASDRCRLTALRVAAAGGLLEVLPAARQLAVSGRTDLLRAAAIATLGDFADPSDRELLASIASSGNRQLSSAAISALTKIDKLP